MVGNPSRSEEGKNFVVVQNFARSALLGWWWCSWGAREGMHFSQSKNARLLNY